MKLRLALVLVVVTAACADEGDEPSVDPSGTGDPQRTDGGASGERDAAVDAPPDAPTRVCSDDNFCHTELRSKQTLLSVWSDGAGIAWAGSREGTIFRWDGAKWSEHARGLGEIRAIWGSSATDLWAGGALGIFHGTGATSAEIAFTKITLPDKTRADIVGLWGTSPNDVWAVGARADDVRPPGLVYHFSGASSDDGAPSWTRDDLSLAEDTVYNRVWGSPGTGIWIVANTAPPDEPWLAVESVLHRPPSATAFTKVQFPYFPTDSPYLQDGIPIIIHGGASVSDTTVWLAATTNHIVQDGYYRGVTKDGGQTFDWTITEYRPRPGIDPEVRAIAGSETDVWTAGEYGRLKVWDGKTFTQASLAIKNAPVIAPFYGVWTVTGGEVWAVGKGIALHRAKK